MEKLDYLIDYLLKERNEEINLQKLSMQDKKTLFRSLCNVRKASNISDEFLNIQDEYLQEELKKKVITESTETSRMQGKMYLWKGDITTLKITAIVNAANSQGLGCFIPCHKCIDNSIHSASGIQLRLECYEKMKEIKSLETGKAFITKAYNLPSKYIIHTVGPIIYGKVTNKEKEELKACYINSLELAKKNNIREIAFCSISTGEFRFPKDEACRVALKTVSDYLVENEEYFDKIVFNVFTDEDYEIYVSNFKQFYRTN